MRKQKRFAVIASKTPDLTSARKANVALAEFKCDDCSNRTVTLSALKPYCGHCGSAKTTKVAKASTSLLNARKDEELSAVKCTGCGYLNIMSDAALASLGGQVGCITCGTHLVSIAEEEVDTDEDDLITDMEAEESDDMEDDMDAEESGEDCVDAEESDDDSDDEDTDEDSEDEDDTEEASDDSDEDDDSDSDEEDEDEDEDDTEEASDDSEEIVDIDAEESEDDYDSEDDEDDVEVSMDMDMDMDAEESEDEDEDMSGDDLEESLEDEVEESTDIPVLDMVESEDDSESEDEDEGDDMEVSFTVASDVIHAFANGRHVAKLVKRAETANADIFGSDKYMKAIQASVQADGLRTALEDFGFELATVRISNKVLSSYTKRVETAKAEKTVNEALATFKNVFKQSLALAATGLNRQYFKGKTHEVKARLYSDLVAAGISDAAAILDSAFADAEDAHNTTLLSLAFDIAEKPEEIRNQMSDSIDNINPAIASSARESALAAASSRLEQTMIPVKETTVASVTGGSRVKALASMRKAGGGRLFRSKN